VVTPTEDSSYPELEKLVNEIKQGKRIVLYPVGGLSFVAVIMVLIVSFVILTSPLIYVIGSERNRREITSPFDISALSPPELLYLLPPCSRHLRPVFARSFLTKARREQRSCERPHWLSTGRDEI